ncbi:MAG: hypothetical protein DRG83_21425 [Deltaproteobacteria bacterium]|nr:MAG: hypothetical protein DRG83_21425 [Deltaproteobacteria bacterium]
MLGPRQCGKTTLARKICEEIDPCEFFDLENPLDLARLETPLLALESLRGLVVLDEIQRKPELFEILRVLMDSPKCEASFLLLGSASPRLVRGVSETLAGRVTFVHMSGFTLDEIGGENFMRLWLRGGFPRSYLAENDELSFRWRMDFVQTFLERDIPQLGIHIPAQALRRFWVMLAHYHGQIWNASTFAHSISTSQKTAKRYLDILTDAFVVRQLQPWFENIKKRQVKSPKVYVRDTGILHALLGMETERDLYYNPRLGASWEGFVVEQIVTMAHNADIYFWATHAGTELDAMLMGGTKRIGIEIRYTDAPKITKSIRMAMKDLNLDYVYIVYPGRKTFPLEKKIDALSIRDLSRILA